MSDTVDKRIPPHDENAERSVIGSMIMSRKALAAALEILEPEDFYDRSYAAVFEAMRDLSDEDIPVDVVTLTERLARKNLPAEISDISFIRGIVASVPFAANAAHYAGIVKEKSTFRRLITAAMEIEDDCFSEQESAEDILDSAERRIFSVLQQRTQQEFVPIREAALEALKRIEEAAKRKSNITGIATGFVDLDNKMSGLQDSDFILIAARPSMGKTSFALNICEYLAFREKMPVAFFSLEMPREQLVNRFYALEGRIDMQNLRTGRLTPEEWERLVTSSGVIGTSNIIIDDTPNITIRELRSRARRYKMDHQIRCIFIDYLQLMAGAGQNRQQEISDISRALKGLARELDVPVVALSQLNRSVEQRDDHRPMLSDLRESGAIEQDADVVMFLYNDDYYHKDREKKNITEIIIAKQRNGPTGTVELVWLPEYTKFHNKRRNL